MVGVHLDFLGNIGFNIQARQFSVISDEPPEFGGDDRGISSVELLLAAIGSCTGTSFGHCLKNMEITPEDIQVDVTGTMTHPEGNPLRVVDLHATISYQVAPGYDPELLDTCVEKFKKYCVVSQSVNNGIPVTIDVVKKDE
jgi:uncharacterized OsmC-like protein